MLAALLREPYKLNVEEYYLSELKENEILLRVNACGICGTDFHIFKGDAPAGLPVIPGHEFTGEIVEVHKTIKSFKVGDRVAVDPNIYCGYCPFCRQGEINLCQNLRALGVTINGGFSQYSIVPVTQAYLLPDNFPPVVAAFAEPLSCCIHGIHQADIKVGQNVAIVGVGTIGLLMLQLARLNGAARIIAIDPSHEKHIIAQKLGADLTISPENPDLLNIIKEFTSGGADVVIECVGNARAAETAITIAKKGGRIVIFGLADKSAFISLMLQSFFHRELTLKSSILNPFTFQTAVDLLANKKVITELFNPVEIGLNNQEIISLFTSPKDDSVTKYMIVPD